MKPAGLLLIIPAGFVAMLSAEEPATGLTSRETKARIREGLPVFQPALAKGAGSKGTDSDIARDPDTLVLPKMRILEKRLPPDAADHLMSREEFKRKMENIYYDEIAKDGPLNYFLNCFTIPILSPSKAARGRGIYVGRELDRLSHLIEVSKALDPDAAKKFEREVDNSWTTDPPSRK
ncbi:MAG TPA: hypothetical protein VG734_24675 [Lacunisphaera sp.]|nr:hypothetical protein [Lacunisphaera sp.]